MSSDQNVVVWSDGSLVIADTNVYIDYHPDTPDHVLVNCLDGDEWEVVGSFPLDTLADFVQQATADRDS